VLTARAGSEPVWRVKGRNVVLPLVIAFSVATVAIVPVVPALAQVFHMRALDGAGWLLAVGVAAATVLAPEVLKLRLVKGRSVLAPPAASS